MGCGTGRSLAHSFTRLGPGPPAPRISTGTLVLVAGLVRELCVAVNAEAAPGEWELVVQLGVLQAVHAATADGTLHQGTLKGTSFWQGALAGQELSSSTETCMTGTDCCKDGPLVSELLTQATPTILPPLFAGCKAPFSAHLDLRTACRGNEAVVSRQLNAINLAAL